MLRKISFVVCVFTLFLTAELYSQNIAPSVQAKIDSLNAWMQEQLATSGTIDTAELQKWNVKIREEQKRVKESQMADTNPGEPKDARIKKFSGYVGTAFTVPEKKMWRVKRVTVSAGLGEYSVLVTSVKFDQDYRAGDVIFTPGFSSEAALLTQDQTTVLYAFEIMEFDVE